MLADLTVAVVVVAAVTPAIFADAPEDAGVTCIEYGFDANAVGKVTDPDVAFTETVPHCINRPFGSLVYPDVPRENEPRVKLFVDIAMFAVSSLAEMIWFGTVKLLPIAAIVLLTDRILPVLFEKEIVSVVLITILGPLLFPDVIVSGVAPSLVLIVDVVNVDIR